METRFMGPPWSVYVLALLLLNACRSQPPMDMSHMHQMTMTGPAADLDHTMRQLWSEEMVLTRRYAARGTQDIADRLSAKQKEIADAIAGYAGSTTGQKFVDLMKRDDNAGVASLLADATLEPLLQQRTDKDIHVAFDAALQIADKIVHNLMMRYPQRF